MDLIDPNTLASESISAKGAALTSFYNSAAYPHDWTEGSGALPSTGSAGEIDIPAPATGLKRLWFFVQNQGTVTLPVRYECRKADGQTQSFVTVLLGPGQSAASQGGSDERGFSAFVPQGQIKVGNSTISALSGMQVAVMEVVE